MTLKPVCPMAAGGERREEEAITRHPCHLTAEEWQGQLSCYLTFGKGSRVPDLDSLPQGQLCCATQVRSRASSRECGLL